MHQVYINSLDESDLQFYATYGQSVVIPFAEDSVQAGLANSSITIIPAEIPHRTLQLPFIIIPIAIPVLSSSRNHIPWLVLWATSRLQRLRRRSVLRKIQVFLLQLGTAAKTPWNTIRV
jgi:hypothetical protein